MAVRRADPPSIYGVVTYWRRQATLRVPSGPGCFSCFRWVPGDLDLTQPGRWNRSGVRGYLQRAHLVAHTHGGSFNPHNLVMLCPQCHYEFDRVLQVDRDAALYRLDLLRQQIDSRYAEDNYRDARGGALPGPIKRHVERGEPPGIPATGGPPLPWPNYSY